MNYLMLFYSFKFRTKHFTYKISTSRDLLCNIHTCLNTSFILISSKGRTCFHSKEKASGKQINRFLDSIFYQLFSTSVSLVS